MKQYIIDFGEADFAKVSAQHGISGLFFAFYRVIIAGLEFPDWCGANISAIWDLITGGMELPAEIIIKGAAALPDELSEKYHQFIETLDEAVDYFTNIDEVFSYVIKVV